MLGTFEESEFALGSRRGYFGSLATASVVLVGASVFLALFGNRVVQEVEKQVEVKFVEELAEPEPPPPPKIKKAPPPAAAAPVVPDHLKTVIVDTPPPVKPLEAPIEMDKAPLKEADPSQDKGVMVVRGAGQGDPAGLEGGTLGAEAPMQKTEAPALPEQAEPPRPSDDNLPPEYPIEAKASGKTGTVILKVVIDETGNVEDVKIMRGDEPFVAAALAAVKSWKYEPAKLGGKAIRVYRIIKIPFQLRT
jgi:periplasmic protein TonB